MQQYLKELISFLNFKGLILFLDLDPQNCFNPSCLRPDRLVDRLIKPILLSQII